MRSPAEMTARAESVDGKGEVALRRTVKKNQKKQKIYEKGGWEQLLI